MGETRHLENVLVVRSGRVLTLLEWHSVRVGRYRRKLYLWVDGMVNYAVLQPSDGISDFDNLIYFGKSTRSVSLFIKSRTWVNDVNMKYTIHRHLHIMSIEIKVIIYSD